MFFLNSICQYNNAGNANNNTGIEDNRNIEVNERYVTVTESLNIPQPLHGFIIGTWVNSSLNKLLLS